MRSAEGIAEALAARLVAIEGVDRVYPPHVPGAAILTLVGATRAARDAEVIVDGTGSELRVAARLGTSRTTPSRVVVDHALAAVLDVVGPQRCRIDIELASVD